MHYHIYDIIIYLNNYAYNTRIYPFSFLITSDTFARNRLPIYQVYAMYMYFYFIKRNTCNTCNNDNTQSINQSIYFNLHHSIQCYILLRLGRGKLEMYIYHVFKCHSSCMSTQVPVISHFQEETLFVWTIPVQQFINNNQRRSDWYLINMYSGSNTIVTMPDITTH